MRDLARPDPARLGADRRLPIYQRVKDALAARIAGGEWRPGETIPPEADLAAEFGVALGTVRKAIEGLVLQGLLDRRQGRGTFVRRADFGNTLFRFFRHTGKGGAPLAPKARLLGRRVAEAGRGPAKALGLRPEDRVLRLSRLRLVDDEPLVVEEIALPLPRFAALLELPADQFGDLLYPLYERVAGVAVARASEHIGFDYASAAAARALGIATDEPVVVIERVAFGFDETALEWRRSRGPAMRFSYDIEIR